MADLDTQVVKAKASLDNLFQTSVSTFAYPFLEITPELRKVVMDHHFLARGGAGGYYLLDPEEEPDWSNIPSYMTQTRTGLATYLSWVDKALDGGNWFVFLIHGIEGTPWGYEPIPRATFTGLLDYLVDQEPELWVAPFGAVGAYWRAQKALEDCQPVREGAALDSRRDRVFFAVAKAPGPPA